MSGEVLALLIWACTAAILASRAWRRVDVRRFSADYGAVPPEEPCWTEEVRGRDGLSYGRTGCHHAALQEMDARARRGEFTTPY